MYSLIRLENYEISQKYSQDNSSRIFNINKTLHNYVEVIEEIKRMKICHNQQSQILSDETSRDQLFKNKFIKRVGNFHTRKQNSMSLMVTNMLKAKWSKEEGDENSLKNDNSIEKDEESNKQETNSKLQEDDILMSTNNTNNLQQRISEKQKSFLTNKDNEEVISVNGSESNKFPFSMKSKHNIENFIRNKVKFENQEREISPLQFSK